MKTTLDLPEDLMREVKVRAAREDRKLKDLIPELLQMGLDKSDASKPPRKKLTGKEWVEKWQELRRHRPTRHRGWSMKSVKVVSDADHRRQCVGWCSVSE